MTWFLLLFNTVDIPKWNKIWLILSGRKNFPLGKLILCFASWQIIYQVSKYNSNCIIYTKQGTLQTTLTCYNNHNLHNAKFKVELCSKISSLIRIWSCQKVHYIKQSSCFDLQSLQVQKTTKLVIKLSKKEQPHLLKKVVIMNDFAIYNVLYRAKCV